MKGLCHLLHITPRVCRLHFVELAILISERVSHKRPSLKFFPFAFNKEGRRHLTKANTMQHAQSSSCLRSGTEEQIYIFSSACRIVTWVTSTSSQIIKVFLLIVINQCTGVRIHWIGTILSFSRQTLFIYVQLTAGCRQITLLNQDSTYPYGTMLPGALGRGTGTQ